MKTNDQELILDYLHGRPGVDTARLNELLRTDAEARAFLRKACAAEVRLRELALGQVNERPVTTKASSAWRRPLAWAASVALMAVATWLLWPRSSALMPQVARLISTTNAHWDDSTTELRLNSGDEPSGPLRLAEGRAEFLTAAGASVMMEGPAELRFEDARSLVVGAGRVVCRCPTPESRLTVRTAQTQVVDLGTEFAVEVSDHSSTRVAVFSGEVKVASTVLKKGQGVEVQIKGVTVLSPEMLAEMQESFMTDVPVAHSSQVNRLRNGNFSASAGQSGWEMRPPNVRVMNGELRIQSGKGQYWPNARQTIWQADLSGKVLVVRAKGKQAPDDALVDSQFAILKLTFFNGRGLEFAYASRHFQFAGDPVDVFQEAEVAAIAPPGTKGVSVQLMLNARGQGRGTVVFDDVELEISP